ncbi:hypothetical protein RF11_08262 [Thelohanellus kitauei]|uniref:Uncharacterized protein n=1 Tax=Thelohanellus kitauei TaxID=669202 RepID=A0A0C2J229_THEKT|nr:hypothetical protein RF11_08262 [Thelohanellus kitauei]
MMMMVLILSASSLLAQFVNSAKKIEQICNSSDSDLSRNNILPSGSYCYSIQTMASNDIWVGSTEVDNRRVQVFQTPVSVPINDSCISVTKMIMPRESLCESVTKSSSASVDETKRNAAWPIVSDDSDVSSPCSRAMRREAFNTHQVREGRIDDDSISGILSNFGNAFIIYSFKIQMKLLCLVLLVISIIGPVVLSLVFISERIYNRFLEPSEPDQEMVELLSEF